MDFRPLSFHDSMWDGYNNVTQQFLTTQITRAAALKYITQFQSNEVRYQKSKLTKQVF